LIKIERQRERKDEVKACGKTVSLEVGMNISKTLAQGHLKIQNFTL
jgi:hypothetical protein